ncbi:hypothetical protein [Amycolatopsis thermoflava]|uniref:hypothetical protein n=1 Tax=Amycolatopsis thermoflava TaxID=84480 RepID=UPI00365E564F
MTRHALIQSHNVTLGELLTTRLATLIARFVATCGRCGARIPADQVMCSVCANK